MPLVRPFRGLGYSLERCGATSIPDRIRIPGDASRHPGRLADLTDLACPPYDVIDDAQRDALLERDPHNAVRLELNPSAEPHAASADALRSWTREGVLERRTDTAVYYYNHATTADADEPTVQGVLARVLLEPWGAGVRPHEHTMPGPKQDRLDLLRATETQLSPILAVYFDRSERYRHVMSRAWTDEWRARDADGLLHQVAVIEPDHRLLTYLSRQQLFVADGHHRYETALAHQAEVRSRPEHEDAAPGSLGADWIMAVLVNAELEELEVLATHRLLRRADAGQLRSLVEQPGPLFVSEELPVEDLAGRLERSSGEAAVFGLILPGGGYLLTGNREAVADRMRRERLSTAVQRLDLAVLHAAILDDRLGIDAEAVGRGESLTYTRSSAAAIEAVSRGEAAAAILVRPTRIDQMAEVANAGDVMPQKSTYFYPKLLTGMVFNPLFEAED